MGYAIEARCLTKKFGDLTAVDSVSLSVREGEIFGLLGPNGAGKTTLISMLVTMRKPTSGSATVAGFDVVKNPGDVRRSIGIVFQDPSLDEELTASENLELHAAMYGIPGQQREARIKEVAKMVELSGRLSDQVKTFSGGMRRRLEIARGLMHFPKVLFLDEPTLGLDPQTRAHIWDYVRKLREKNGITVVLTTHYLDEADLVCDRIAIIDQGKIVAQGKPAELKGKLSADRVTIHCRFPARLKRAVWGQDGILKADVAGGRLELRVSDAGRKMPAIVSIANKAKVAIRSLEIRKASLDDVFLHYTGRSMRDEPASAKDSLRIRRRAWGRGR
ncbi:MAG: ATP-binding cassette domain-containing protein [Candidatus Micrarchaeota archaeon]|nr:ATP-binding cassette domain-containing protein [Candidatus Micrarchaeota archaeon]